MPIKSSKWSFNCSCMDARATRNQWTESMQPSAAARTAVVASICQCSESLKDWWIRFDPVQSLNQSQAVDMFNVNYETRVGTVDLMGQFGQVLPWRDFHFRFKEFYKSGDDGQTPDQDWDNAVDLSSFVTRANEIEVLHEVVKTGQTGEKEIRRL